MKSSIWVFLTLLSSAHAFAISDISCETKMLMSDGRIYSEVSVNYFSPSTSVPGAMRATIEVTEAAHHRNGAEFINQINDSDSSTFKIFTKILRGELNDSEGIKPYKPLVSTENIESLTIISMRQNPLDFSDANWGFGLIEVKLKSSKSAYFLYDEHSNLIGRCE